MWNFCAYIFRCWFSIKFCPESEYFHQKNIFDPQDSTQLIDVFSVPTEQIFVLLRTERMKLRNHADLTAIPILHYIPRAKDFLLTIMHCTLHKISSFALGRSAA